MNIFRKIKDFFESRKAEKKAKELYLKIEDLEAEERKKLQERAKMLEIAKLMRENMILRKEIEKLKEYQKKLEEKLEKKYREEEIKAIEFQKKIKSQREIKLFFYSNPPIQVISFDTNYPFLTPEGNYARFLCGIKLSHILGVNEPYVYPLVSTKPIKGKIPKDENIHRLILPEKNARFSRISEIISDKDIFVYCLRYGSPIQVDISDYVIENSRARNSVRAMILTEKPIAIMNNGKYFKNHDGKTLKYLAGFEFVKSKYKEPLVFPLLTNEKVKNKIKEKHYTVSLKDSEIYFSELFSLFLDKEKMIDNILKNKPLKLSITSEGVFVKDYVW